MVEGDREHYAFGMPYVLMPDIASSDITDSLTEENYYVLMPISQGMTVGSSSNGTVTSLLTTSDTAFSKVAGYSLETYEKEDGDIDGPFTVGLSIEDNSGGQIVWFSSSTFLEDVYKDEKSPVGRHDSVSDSCGDHLGFCQWRSSAGNAVSVSVHCSEHLVFWRLGNRTGQIPKAAAEGNGTNASEGSVKEGEE